MERSRAAGYLDIRTELRSDGIAVITFDKADVLNAFSRRTADEVRAALDGFAADDAARAIVLTGAGRGFCAGADRTGFNNAGPEPDSPHFWKNGTRRDFFKTRFSLAHAIYACPKPVIAAVNGPAVGMGLGIALACDVRIASTAARFNAMFVRRGLASDFATAWLLRETVGRARALELLWRADMVTADEAFALGMVARVVPAETLMEETFTFLAPVVKGPPLAVEAIKSLVNFRLADELDDYQGLEEMLQMMVKDSTEDVQEASAAAREKREPRFRGR